MGFLVPINRLLMMLGCGLAVAIRAKLKDTGQRVFKAPGKLWKHVVNNSQRFKRIVKVSTALTLAIGITVPTPFADFYGENFVLLGTIVSAPPPPPRTVLKCKALLAAALEYAIYSEWGRIS